MFMRYISHEMRTPLNVACLGMKILRDELERLGLLSLLETAIDTEKSCKTAVDILNDMLLFDKIVSGLMTLEKRLMDPLDFITKVMHPFHLQVDLSSPTFVIAIVLDSYPVLLKRLGRLESTSDWSRPSLLPLSVSLPIHTRFRR